MDHDDSEDAPEIAFRHFFTCRSAWFDIDKSELGIYLAGIYTQIDSKALIPILSDSGVQSFPFVLGRVFVYFQVWGVPFTAFDLRIRLVRIETGDDEDEIEQATNLDGGHQDFFPPYLFEFSGLDFVEEYAFVIQYVRFDGPGLYE